MIKTFTSKLVTGATLSCLSAALLLAPQQASAGRTVSKGHGVKCYWVTVSSDPATGSIVHKQVCRKIGV